MTDNVLNELFLVEEKLQGDAWNNHQRPEFLCLSCGYLSRCQTVQCRHRDSIKPSFCTNESRVALYFKILRRESVWGSLRTLNANTGMDMRRNMLAASSDRSHSCKGEAQCPLVKKMADLSKAVARVVDNVQGVSIPSRAVQTNGRQLTSLSLAE